MNILSQLPWRVVLPLLMVHLGYVSLHNWQASFVVEGERYFYLGEDAMISMRYARNLAAGEGLVWNPGEAPVEGITNPLWTGVMALSHLLPIADSKTSLPVRVVGEIMVLLAAFAAAALALRLGQRPSVAVAALALTLFYMPLLGYALLGFEAVAVAALLTMAVERAIASIRAERFTLAPYLLLGMATLIRPDAASLLVALMAALACWDPARRRTHLYVGFATLAFFVGGQTVARLLYYGEPLPNTYYLKMTGFPVGWRITRGAFMLFRFLWSSNPILWLVALLAVLVARTPWIRIVMILVAVQLVYSAYVGGDTWESAGVNRYIAVVMPLFMVLLAAGIGALIESMEVMRRQSDATWCLTLFVALLFLNGGHAPSRMIRAFPFIPVVNPAPYEHMLGTALAIQRHTDERATIAVASAGVVPYFSRRPAVDLLGKSDAHIARLSWPHNVPPVSTSIFSSHRFTAFRPGHTKWDLRHSLEDHRPDLVVDSWVVPYPEWPESIRRIYWPVMFSGREMYARRGSRWIRGPSSEEGSHRSP